MTEINDRQHVVTKSPLYERWRWQTFFITWLAYLGFYLTRKSFSVAKIGMGEGTEFDLSSAQMSVIDGAYLIAYTVGDILYARNFGEHWGFNFTAKMEYRSNNADKQK